MATVNLLEPLLRVDHRAQATRYPVEDVLDRVPVRYENYTEFGVAEIDPDSGDNNPNKFKFVVYTIKECDPRKTDVWEAAYEKHVAFKLLRELVGQIESDGGCTLP